MRILIVDDNKIALAVLRNALVQNGHEVVTAADGQQALAALRGGSCRIIISDWEMPADAVILKKFVAPSDPEDLLGYVYIILLTSHNQPEEKVEGLRAGANYFIGKPFDPSEFDGADSDRRANPSRWRRVT